MPSLPETQQQLLWVRVVHLNWNTQRLCSMGFLSLLPQGLYCWATALGVSEAAFSADCMVLSRSLGCHYDYKELENLALGFHATRLHQMQRRWGLGIIQDNKSSCAVVLQASVGCHWEKMWSNNVIPREGSMQLPRGGIHRQGRRSTPFKLKKSTFQAWSISTGQAPPETTWGWRAAPTPLCLLYLS